MRRHQAFCCPLDTEMLHLAMYHTFVNLCIYKKINVIQIIESICVALSINIRLLSQISTTKVCGGWGQFLMYWPPSTMCMGPWIFPRANLCLGGGYQQKIASLSSELSSQSSMYRPCIFLFILFYPYYFLYFLLVGLLLQHEVLVCQGFPFKPSTVEFDACDWTGRRLSPIKS